MEPIWMPNSSILDDDFSNLIKEVEWKILVVENSYGWDLLNLFEWAGRFGWTLTWQINLHINEVPKKLALQHSVEIAEIHSHSFFDKYFVKVTLLLKSWFHEIIFGESEFLIYSHCVKVAQLRNSVKFSEFFYFSDFTWNQFLGFQKGKKCHLNTFRGSELCCR